MATSATIVDREHPDAAREFASRFFGVDPAAVVTVGEAYEAHVWGDARSTPPAPAGDPVALLNDCVTAVEANDDGASVRRCYRQLSGGQLPEGAWGEVLGQTLLQNEVVFRIAESLAHPRALGDLPAALQNKIARPVS